jgi:long-chain fatty acid transport protein
MRKISFPFVICLAVALPGWTQNTDIDSLAGPQFNFGNPGARSLGMAGAFLGLADDASAAEANPAGLTILRKLEASIELRNYQEQQIFTTSGTYPDFQRTAFSHYNHRLTFGSVVIPFKRFTIGAYYHEPLRNQGTGEVVPKRNKLSGAIVTELPNFYLAKEGGGPVNKAQCEAIRQRTNDPFSCEQWTVIPFLSAVTVQERTFGIAAAYKIGNVSVGATARYQKFNESAFTFRVTSGGDFSSIIVQATSDITAANEKAKDQNDLTFAGGVKWTPTDKLSVGAVYKQGAKFPAPWFALNANTNFQFVKGADTTFHIPDVYGVGVSMRPIPVLTINADAVRVTYSNLVDDFVSVNADIRALGDIHKANDVIELHLGGEYFFFTRFPFAVRAGVWRDPAHSLEFRGPLDKGDSLARATAVTEAVLFPKGQAQNHISIGAGMAWPRFQIDAAYDRSKRYSVGSISLVTRF